MQSYNGGYHAVGDKGCGFMNFEVDAPRSALVAVRDDLLRIAAVTAATFHKHVVYDDDW